MKNPVGSGFLFARGVRLASARTSSVRGMTGGGGCAFRPKHLRTAIHKPPPAVTVVRAWYCTAVRRVATTAAAMVIGPIDWSSGQFWSTPRVHTPPSEEDVSHARPATTGWWSNPADRRYTTLQPGAFRTGFSGSSFFFFCVAFLFGPFLFRRFSLSGSPLYPSQTHTHTTQ